MLFTLEQAIEKARQGIKMTHKYFTEEAYILVQGNMIVFEDGVKVFINDWTEDKPYLNTDWSEFKQY